MAKKKNTPRRVSVETKANGEVHMAIREKSPNFSIAMNKKKNENKKRCRQKNNDDFYFGLSNDRACKDNNIALEYSQCLC